MRYSLILLLLSTLFISCDMQNESEKLLIEDAIYSLERSNESLDSYAVSNIMAFNSKLSDPMQANKAKEWKSTVDSLILISNDATKVIHQILTKYFGSNSLQKYSNAKNIVLNFKREGGDTMLFKVINNYHKQSINLNEEMAIVFKKDINTSFKDFVDLKNMNNYSIKNYSKISDNQLYLKIIELKNRILNLKYKSLEFCNNKSSVIFCGYVDAFSTIVSQNSTIFRKGQRVEVSAGMGKFSFFPMPNISISNKKIEVNPNGVAIYEFAAPNKKGKYRIPVNIEYTKPDGTKETRGYKIEYEVVD